MNTNFTHHIAMVLIAAATALAAGCASVAVSSDAIERNAAAALGLERGSVTISDRVDGGVNDCRMTGNPASYPSAPAR